MVYCTFLVANLVLLCVFLVDVMIFKEVLALPNAFFHIWTNVEQEMYWQTADQNTKIVVFSELTGILATFINFFALQYLLYGHLYSRKVILPIRRAWKISVPLGGLLLYLPIYFYIKYDVTYFLLYMALIPAVILSMVTLILGLIGAKNLRK